VIVDDYSSKLIGKFFEYTPPYELVATNKNAELALIREADQDPAYVLMNKDGMQADFSTVGLVKRVAKLPKRQDNILVERENGYGEFVVTGTERLEHILERVYGEVTALKFKEKEEQDLFAWRASQVIARFGDFRQLFSPQDIIPEFNDNMVVIKLSDGCGKGCKGCPEGTIPLRLYDEKRIRENVVRARRIERHYHEGHLERMDEGFLDSSDLLLFGERAAGIVTTVGTIFPEVIKWYAFASVKNVLKAPARQLNELREAGLYSVLLGIETAHEPTSRIWGKTETAEMKTAAVKRLQEIGYKVKPIVQIGMVGEGFVYNDRFYSGKEGLEATASWAADVIGTPLERSARRNGDVKLLISRHIDGIGSERKGIVPYRHANRAEEDLQFFLRQLQRHGVDIYDNRAVEQGYEAAIRR